jgi:hypothetical protein
VDHYHALIYNLFYSIKHQISEKMAVAAICVLDASHYFLWTLVELMGMDCYTNAFFFVGVLTSLLV